MNLSLKKYLRGQAQVLRYSVEALLVAQSGLFHQAPYCLHDPLLDCLGERPRQRAPEHRATRLVPALPLDPPGRDVTKHVVAIAGDPYQGACKTSFELQRILNRWLAAERDQQQLV